MTYTSKQLEAVEEMLKWDSRPLIQIEDIAFVLKGYAGTGKTTVAKRMVEVLKKRGKSVGLAAPTHFAKDIISTKVGLPADTLQRLLGLKPNAEMEEYSPNVRDFIPVTEPLLNDYDYVLIDECSMINSALLLFLLTSANENGCKIIFMGDPFQLPPIGETLSKTFKISHGFTLDEIIRQDKENPNTELIATFIQDLINGTQNGYETLKKGISVENELGSIHYLPNKEYYQKAIEVFGINHEEVLNSRIITYSNNSVKEINRFINKHINEGELFTKGQYILGYKTILRDVNEVANLGRDEKNWVTLKDVYISNSCAYKIKDTFEKTVEYQGVSHNCQVIVTTGNSTFLTLLENDTDDYLEEVSKLVEFGKKTRKWSGMYEYRDLFLTNFNIFEEGANRPIVTKSFDYAYAMTTHKAQGATFENVFVNFPAYRNIWDKRLRTQLLYVALTRTSKNNFILL